MSPISEPSQHTIATRRTARYFTAGNLCGPSPELWFVLHGYGQLAPFFIRNFYPLLQPPGRLVVAPEGLSRFYLGADQWERVGATWMTKVEREDEIADQQAYLNAVLAEVLDAQPCNTTPTLTVFGFSQGVATAWRWVDRNPKLSPANLVLWAGMAPAEYQHIRHKKELRLWMASGLADPFIGPERREETGRTIAKTGLPHAWLEFDGAHNIPAEALLRLAAQMRAA